MKRTISKAKMSKPNSWELTSCLVEIYWRKNVATMVKLNGSIFHAAHRVQLKVPKKAPTAVAGES